MQLGEYHGWKSLVEVKNELKKIKADAPRFKKSIVIMKLSHPLIKGFTQEEAERICGEGGNEIIDIEDSLQKAIATFNRRDDGQRITLLEIGKDAPYLVLGATLREGSDPSRLIGSNISKWLYNDYHWNVFSGAPSRLFEITVHEFSDKKLEEE